MKYNQLFSVVLGFSFFFITSSFCGKDPVLSGDSKSNVVSSTTVVAPTAPPLDFGFDFELDDEPAEGLRFSGVLPNDAKVAGSGVSRLSDVVGDDLDSDDDLPYNDRVARGLRVVASVSKVCSSRREDAGGRRDRFVGTFEEKPRGVGDTSGDEALAYKFAREEGSLSTPDLRRDYRLRVPMAAPDVPVGGGVGRSLVRASDSRTSGKTSAMRVTASGVSGFGARPHRPTLMAEPKKEYVPTGWMRTYSPPRNPRRKWLPHEIRDEGEARSGAVLLPMASCSRRGETSVEKPSGVIEKVEGILPELPHLMTREELDSREKSKTAFVKFIAENTQVGSNESAVYANMLRILEADDGVFAEVYDASFKALKRHLKIYGLRLDADMIFALRESLKLAQEEIETRWTFRDKTRYEKGLHVSAVKRLRALLECSISESEKLADGEKPRGRIVCTRLARR